MKNKNKYYVTTPIYYPSGKPHLGSAYTTIAADILARFNKLMGKEVFFLTGTDEHTKKVTDEADKAGKEIKEYLDHITKTFKNSWKELNIKYDRFIRTSDKDHKKLVTEVLKKVNEKGDIYKGFYEGHYCSDCEAYYTERETPNLICPTHEKPLKNLKEETYFFKLSKYQNQLLDHYNKNPGFISPEHRKKEIINRVKEELKDLSISRTELDWGIKLPFDNKHTCYVWFDALTNYLTGVGMLEDKKLFNKFWPANTHIIGKDILWFHSVIWPAMLLSAEISLPEKVFAHGWLTLKDKKIGKSAGNAANLDELIKKYGVDSIRYFLFKTTPFGDDGEYSEQTLIDRHNELANKLGNLISRVTSLAEKNGIKKTSNTLTKKLKIKDIEKLIQNLEFDKALNFIFAFIDTCNEYVQEKKPWETKDQKVLYELIDSIKAVSIVLWPFIPSTSEKIANQLNFKISHENINKPIETKKIKKGEILFKRIE
ncbi:methionine--tRNA ligase [Candidatus Pacearchaeota archaeon]|nr:methionine--tRNA ligase [Candidatus Pacearchaeota archaeon]